MISYHHLEILITATFVKSTRDKLPLWNVINLTPCWGPLVMTRHNLLRPTILSPLARTFYHIVVKIGLIDSLRNGWTLIGIPLSPNCSGFDFELVFSPHVLVIFSLTYAKSSLFTCAGNQYRISGSI